MDGTDGLLIIDLLRSGIRLASPILLAALGGAISNRAGVLDFALEGKMLLGSFLGILSAYWLQNSYGGALVAVLAGGLLGAIFAFFYLKYKVDLVILAIAINLLISEGTVFFLRTFYGNVGTWTDSSIKQLPDIQIPIVKDIPIIGEILSGYNAIIYTSWILTALLYVVLFHTPFGRHIRAVGENKEAAEALGINVSRVRYFALILGGGMCALGGAFLSIGHLTMFTRNMSNGRGWIAVTAALFGMNNPIGVFLASLLFGVADALAVRLQMLTTIPPMLIQFLPNAMAILALVLVALRNRANGTLIRRKYSLQSQRKS
jgi:ABC-type uncharacterized transport system permease subunit